MTVLSFSMKFMVSRHSSAQEDQLYSSQGKEYMIHYMLLVNSHTWLRISWLWRTTFAPLQFLDQSNNFYVGSRNHKILLPFFEFVDWWQWSQKRAMDWPRKANTTRRFKTSCGKNIGISIMHAWCLLCLTLKPTCKKKFSF
jgi:hypothetical protein